MMGENYLLQVKLRKQWLCILKRNMSDVQLNKLSEAQTSALERNFSVEEVWEAISGCEGGMATGPDGISFNIIKSKWELLKEDIMRWIQLP